MRIKILIFVITSVVIFSFTSYGKYLLSQINIDFHTELIGYIDNQGNGYGKLQNLYLSKTDFENNNEKKSILIADSTPLLEEYDFTLCKGHKVKVIGKHSFRTPRKEGIVYDLKSIYVIDGEMVEDCLRYKE